MKKAKDIKITFLLVLTMTILLSASLAEGQFKDFGSPDDFDTTDEIFIEPRTGDYSWRSRTWYNTWINPETWMTWYENPSQFYWITAPSNMQDVISSRAIKFRHKAYIHFDATDFNPDDILYLTIRYKDDIGDGTHNGAPIYSYNSGDYVYIGNIGGDKDHRWKTEQFTITPSQRSVSSTYGDYIIRIGECSYCDSLIGELPIDKIKLSENSNTAEFESDIQGLWPDMPSDNFNNIGRDNIYWPGGEPFFPYGVYSYHWVSDGGSATSPGYGDKDSWQLLEDTHLNCYVLHGWQENWYSEWEPYPNECDWDDPGVLVDLGLDEHLIQAGGHNLKIIPNFLTDTRAWWINNQYNGEIETLDYLEQVMYDHRDHPNILMWNPVDEWDHEDISYGKPHLFSRQLYEKQRLADPNRPGFISMMGFMGPSSWELAAENTEVIGTDYYLFGPGTTVENQLLSQASRLDDMRSTLGDSVARIMIPEAMIESVDSPYIIHDDEARTLYPEEIVAQAYMAIAHGAQGIIYFRWVHPDDTRADDYGGYDRVRQGLKQVGEELFATEGGIAHSLISPSTTIDIMGENNIVTSSDSSIHHIYKQANDGKYLITINGRKSNQETTFTINGLEDNTQIQVLFEGRTLTSNGNQFTDSYGSLDRHVYLISGESASSSPMKIDHTCTDLSQIPDEWIDAAQANLQIYFAHTSHGQQIPCGLDLIEQLDSRFNVAVGEGYLPNEPDALNILNDQGIDPNEYWLDDGYQDGLDFTRQVLTDNPEIDVSIFCWCVQLQYADEQYVNDYFDAISILESEFPDVSFIHFTGHAQAHGSAGHNRHIRNDQIRQYCQDNNKICFDFEDLDAWWFNPSTQEWEFDYYDHGGIQVPYWNEDGWDWINWCGHAGPEACEQKGKAFWWMMARLAGWQDDSGSEDNFVRGDVDENGIISTEDYVYILKSLYVPGAPIPSCMDSADVNDDGDITMSDAIYIMRYLNLPGSPNPPAPFPNCGPDPTVDSLDCLCHNICLG